MTYPRQQRAFLMTGINTDLPTWLVPSNQWTDGLNVVARDGAMKRVLGHGDTLGAPTPTNVLKIMNLLYPPGAASVNQNYWVYVNSSSQYVIKNDGTGETDLTLAGSPTYAGENYKHSLFALNNVAIHNPGGDEAPMYWAGDTGDNFAILPGWVSEFGANIDCLLMRPIKFHLVAMNFQGDPDRVAWSSAADPNDVPTSWTAAADNDAGAITLGSGPGNIVAAESFGEPLFIYKQGELWAMEFVGGNDVFAFRKVFSRFSPMGPQSIADINNRHAVLTNNDVVVHDGNTIQSIARSRVKNTIFSKLPDGEERIESQVFYNRLGNELWICIPETALQITFIAVFNLQSNEWSFREEPGSVLPIALAIGNVDTDNPPNPFAESIVTFARNGAGTTQDFYELETTDSVNKDANLKRHDMDFGEPSRFKFIRGVRILYQDTTDLEMRVGARDELTNSITWQSWVSVSDQLTYVDLIGRYISLEIRSEGSSDIWTVGGVVFEYEMRGYF